jgi:phosphoadenosine phosphosulfate reductase
VTDVLTYENWDHTFYASINELFKDYLDVLKWSYNIYGDEIVYACSFGAEGVVLTDIISKINKQARIVFLDTDLHFTETYDLIDKIKKRYPTLKIELVKPSLTLNEQGNQLGDELWKHQPDLCCHIRKVQPLSEALRGARAWITGVRRENSPTRQHIQFINKDEKFQLVKICPLIHWTWEEIWMYIKLHNLPYNELHDKGYPSIGCEMCTLPVTDSEDPRSGRWANSNKTECGLHQS